MIPKIIHYCWFGGKEKPQSVIDFIENWRVKCPDYIIKEWNESNFDVYSIPYVKEAYKSKKFAFVSDVARLYALKEEGGIYLDTDIRLLKSFDNMLMLKSFIGKEKPFLLSTAVMGAEKECSWVSSFFATYKNKHFISRSGVLNVVPNTVLLTNHFNREFLFRHEGVEIFDVDFFCAKNFLSGEYLITDNTIAVHEFSGSWKKKNSCISDRLRNIVSRNF